MTARHELRMPELGLDGVAAFASTWLVEVGSPVSEGDRLLEVVAGSVSIDLPSPVRGTLAETLVDEDDRLETGQLLAIVLADPAD